MVTLILLTTAHCYCHSLPLRDDQQRHEKRVKARSQPKDALHHFRVRGGDGSNADCHILVQQDQRQRRHEDEARELLVPSGEKEADDAQEESDPRVAEKDDGVARRVRGRVEVGCWRWRRHLEEDLSR